MPTSNFQQWNPNAANQESDSAYTADSLRSGGAPVNAVFPSATANKLFYQLTTMVTALANYLVGQGQNASDTNLATLTAAIQAAFAAQIPAREQVIVSAIAPAGGAPLAQVSGNTTAEQNLFSLPAVSGSFATGGRFLRIRASGTVIPVNTTEIISFYFTGLGGSPSSIVAQFIPQLAITHYWVLEMVFGYTNTSVGVMDIQFTVEPVTPNTPQSTPKNIAPTNAPLPGLSNPLTASWGVSFGTASGSNVCTQTLASVEVLN